MKRENREVLIIWSWEKSASATKPVVVNIFIEDQEDDSSVSINLTEHEVALLLSGSVVRANARTARPEES